MNRVVSGTVRVLILASLALLASAQTAARRQARVDRLEHAVLAPCCYSEAVAIHQSEIAVKMRLQIAAWVAAGRSDEEILDTYVGLYGSKVLVDPRTVPHGYAPFFPWLVLMLGMILVASLLKRWSAAPRRATAPSTEDLNLPDFDDE